jgi:hypothetical protein
VTDNIGAGTAALVRMLHRVVHVSRHRGTDLEVLGGILAVAVKGYRQAIGHEQAAMLFYGVADDLAVNNIQDDEGEQDGDQPG